jgi:hypothetical protein
MRRGPTLTRIAAGFGRGRCGWRQRTPEPDIRITNDRGLGELVFRHRQPHAGVILLRLGDYTELPTKIERLTYVLTHYTEQLDHFLAVTRHRVRVRRPS